MTVSKLFILILLTLLVIIFQMKRAKQPKSGISCHVRAKHFDLDGLSTTTECLKPGQRKQRKQEASAAQTAHIKGTHSDLCIATQTDSDDMFGLQACQSMSARIC